jgi:hypothetical protein
VEGGGCDVVWLDKLVGLSKRAEIGLRCPALTAYGGSLDISKQLSGEGLTRRIYRHFTFVAAMRQISWNTHQTFLISGRGEAPELVSLASPSWSEVISHGN